MATAQQLIACSPPLGLFQSRRRSRRVVASAGQRLRLASPTRGVKVASPANPSFARRGETARLGDAAMTDRIKEFLARNREDGPRLVVDLDIVRENYLGFAGALPDTRVFYAVKANPAPGDPRSARRARLVLRHRLAGRDRAGASRRRDARPDQLRQHDQEGKGYRARLCARDPPFCRGLRGRG